MKGKLKYYQYILLPVFFLTQCKERFEPNLPIVPQGYLVVEGFINAQGPTQIKLSRTTPIDQKQSFKPELNAEIKVESDNNAVFSLTPSPRGIYSSQALPIDQSHKYRLRIKTKDGKEYLSEFVPVKITPAIDSLSWVQDEKGVQIFVTTHDPQNKTTYYHWDYDETWEIQSVYGANYRYVNGVIRPSEPTDPNVYTCWKYDTSSNIILGSSARLAQDIMYLHPLHFVDNKSERLGIRYSIQIRQYALDKEGYQFMEQMKKNTESLGTIFDPLPSALKGNIRSLSNPGEIVIGYVNATTVQQKRIFIAYNELTGKRFNMGSFCKTDTIPNNPPTLQTYLSSYWPYNAIFARFGFPPPIIAYEMSTIQCVDCRARGGINVKPAFW
jgi:hypothetical protein